MADVRDGRDPPKSGAMERRVLPLFVLRDAEAERGALIVEEDLAEDFGWDAAGPREFVAAVSNHTQRAGDDGKHLAVYQA